MIYCRTWCATDISINTLNGSGNYDRTLGFGSVYFTTGAARNAGNIRIATIEAEIGSADNGDALTTLTGYFYVNGD